MRLERHVGGMGEARQQRYLQTRGWQLTEKGWHHPGRQTDTHSLSRALHHQLTKDLSESLAQWKWAVLSYSQRGYARLQDATTGKDHSLPSALRVEAKRQKQKVADFTYALFLTAVTERG